MKKLLIALLAGLVSVSILSACNNDSYLGGDDEDDDGDQAVTTTTQKGETTAPPSTTAPSTEEKPSTHPNTEEKPTTEEKPSTQPEVHQHTADTIWMADTLNHWKVCSCGEIIDRGTHNLTDEECSECGSWVYVWEVDNSVSVIQYNENGDVIYEADFDTDNQLIAKRLSTYSYNDNDDLLIYHATDYDSNDLAVMTTKVTYTYDNDGMLLTETEVVNDLVENDAYTVVYSYTYDELGNVLTMTTVNYDAQGKIEETQKLVYTYYESGHPKTEQLYINDELTYMYFLEADEDGFSVVVKSLEYYENGTIFVTEYDGYEIVDEYWTDADGNKLDNSNLFNPNAAADLIGTWKGEMNLADIMESDNGELSCMVNVTMTFRNDGTYLVTMDLSYEDFKQFVIMVSEAMLRSIYTDEEFKAATGMTIAEYVANSCNDESLRESYDEMAEKTEGVYYVKDGVLYIGDSWDAPMEAADYTLSGNTLTMEYEGIALTLTKQ